MELRVERVATPREDVKAYLARNLVRNSLDVWNLEFEAARYTLHVCYIDGKVKGHLGIYLGDDAKYVSIGGTPRAAESLLGFVPKKAVVTVPPSLGAMIVRRLKHDAMFPNDIMVVRRGEAKLEKAGMARRLTRNHVSEYSSFGSSFNAPKGNTRWIRERLKKSLVFGSFFGGNLVSIASLVAWLPQVAVVMGVETKEEYRRRGFGMMVVSAAVEEALKRSESCALFVRSANTEAIRLYRKLGFRKFGEEFWIDRGTGIVP